MKGGYLSFIWIKLDGEEIKVICVIWRFLFVFGGKFNFSVIFK